MWQNGYAFTPYRPGVLDRLARLVGFLIGKCVPYLPYVFVALLIYTPGGRDADNTLWNIFVVVVLAAVAFLVERGLFIGLRRLGETNIPASVGFWIFAVVVLVLHIWLVQAGVAMLLHRWSEGHMLSILAAVLFLPVAIVRWIRINFRSDRQ
jgi:hypothetical protein